MSEMNWDDLKFFLAVCDHGSIRAAAKELKVNHATVFRRIAQFESSLEEPLFERSSKGYKQTALAKELYQDASLLQERMGNIQNRLVSQENELQGNLRITFPKCFGKALLMADIADFCQLYPLVTIEIIDSKHMLNLLNREADVAFRLCESPPDYVIGRQLPSIHQACYISRKLLPKLSIPGWLEQQHFLGWTENFQHPTGLITKNYPHLKSKHFLGKLNIQVQACIEGMGVGILPCCIVDKIPDLVRIPPYVSEPKYDFWMLSHPDMKTNQKISTFVHFMAERILEKRALLEGEEFTIPDTSKTPFLKSVNG